MNVTAAATAKPRLPAGPEDALPDILPARRLGGRVVGVYATAKPGSVETAACDRLDLTLDGIAADRHRGFTRKAGPREPWYPRGTEIRSGRQISLVSVEELAEIAGRMALAELRPEWLGANLLVEGVPRLSFLPPGTRLMMAGGAALVVEQQNGPCRVVGRAIARQVPGRPDIELGFPKAAQRLRGVVASVERAGPVAEGASFDVRLAEQWLYR